MREFVELIAGIVIGACMTMLIVILLSGFVSPGYRQGQIDALNGKIHYELVTNEDGSSSWKLKDE